MNEKPSMNKFVSTGRKWTKMSDEYMKLNEDATLRKNRKEMKK